jgi:hypothetical protein
MVWQSLPHIWRYRKTYSIEVTDFIFQNKSPAKGLHVFDDGTTVPKMMG